MRILGVTEKWPKLKKPKWTTFRLQRRDRDWQVGELVQVVYQPRSKRRLVMGVARIIGIELRHFYTPNPQGRRVTFQEALRDGFTSEEEMERWMLKHHGDRVLKEPLNKLTLEWIGEGYEQNV